VSFRPLIMKMIPRHLARVIVLFLLLAAAGEAFVPTAFGQSFTLTPSALSPADGSVNAGGSADGYITIGPQTFTGTVSFTCTVSSTTVTSNLPVCVISPDTVVAPAIPSITITTCPGVTSTCTGPTPTGVYTIAITGTSGTTVVNASLSLNVSPGTAGDYALSVLPATATPSPVNPGNSATTTVTISGIGSYSGTVTVACLSITPIVEAEPYCTFNPPTVTVPSGGPAPTTTLTITTLGPTPTVTEVFHLPRAFYAMFVAFPGIAIIGVTGSRKRRIRFLAFFLLVSVSGSLLLLPACAGPAKNNPNGLTTPKNSYTFTLSASDGNGNGPANSTTPPTVTLTVN
jgi:hypothetical protein